MKRLLKIICIFKGHIWHNDEHYPVHGYHNDPTSNSYCLRCGQVTANWLEGRD